MNLKSIRRFLSRDLMTNTNLRQFDRVKERNPELAEHATVMSVLAVLDDESPENWGHRDKIVRVLIKELQRRPHSFINAILIHTFYPMLSRLRHRLVSDTMTKADLDQLVLTAFLDVVASFSLTQYRDRTCMLIRQTTKRRVFKLLSAEQSEQEKVRPAHVQDLARREETLANLLNGDDFDEEHQLRWPDTSPPKKRPLSRDEQDRLVDFLVEHVGDELEEDRLNLVIATQIRGERLSHVVRRLYPEICDRDRQRTYQRIKRRHSRALVRLRELLSDLYCPHDPPADALPLGSDPDSQGGMER